MRLGLITDIHEHVDNLQTALAVFRAEQVDEIVVIGDVFRTGAAIEPTCRLLSEANAVGVWGNHDFGLCVDPPAKLRDRYGSTVIDFMTTLKPKLEVAGCLFSHVEPWLNPEKIDDLWYFEGLPRSAQQLNRIFTAAPNRLMFAGHYHCWLLAQPDALVDWTGEGRVNLAHGRYFAVIGALCEGRFATLDTESWELTPRQVRNGDEVTPALPP